MHWPLDRETARKREADGPDKMAFFGQESSRTPTLISRGAYWTWRSIHVTCGGKDPRRRTGHRPRLSDTVWDENSKERYLLEEKVEIQFGDISGMEGRSRTLALVGVVNSTFHQLTLNKSASHHALSSLRWKHTTSDFKDVPSSGTAGPSPRLPAFSLLKWADLTCSSYYCCLTTYCWNSALNSKQQCHLLAQCYGWGIWAGISWEVLLLHVTWLEVRRQHSNGHWTEGPSQLLAYLIPDRVGRKKGP